MRDFAFVLQSPWVGEIRQPALVFDVRRQLRDQQTTAQGSDAADQTGARSSTSLKEAILNNKNPTTRIQRRVQLPAMRGDSTILGR